MNAPGISPVADPSASVSRQIFAIPLGGADHLIYSPLKRTAFIANPALVNEILTVREWLDHRSGDVSGASSPCPETHALLDRLDLLTPAPIPEDPFADTGPRWDTAILFPTTRCSLRCVYCYAAAGDGPVREMPLAVARAAIDTVVAAVLENGGEELSLGFHGGGEPSLHPELIIGAADHARRAAERHGLSIRLHGAFNGMASPERGVGRYILDHFSEISLSCDGPPSVQDTQRPTVGGGPSSPAVIRTMTALDRRETAYGVRMTVTEESVDGLAEAVAWIIDHHLPRRIQVEPVFYQGRARRDGFRPVPRDRFVRELVHARATGKSAGVEVFYSGARLDVLTRRFCQAPCRALVVTPDGDVTACFEVHGRSHPAADRLIVGRYDGSGGFSIDRAALAARINRTADRIPECKGCFCKWHCAGDCATREPGGDSDRCRLNRELIIHQLLDRIHRSGGLVWRGEPAEPG
jgi:uncharacterized protein